VWYGRWQTDASSWRQPDETGVAAVVFSSRAKLNSHWCYTQVPIEYANSHAALKCAPAASSAVYDAAVCCQLYVLPPRHVFVAVMSAAAAADEASELLDECHTLHCSGTVGGTRCWMMALEVTPVGAGTVVLWWGAGTSSYMVTERVGGPLMPPAHISTPAGA